MENLEMNIAKQRAVWIKYANQLREKGIIEGKEQLLPSLWSAQLRVG
jgi:hypothetical protein